MRIWRRMLKVSWTQRITNEEILGRVNTKKELMNNICKRQLSFVGHIERKGGLESLCMTGRIEGRRERGRPRKKYLDWMKFWEEDGRMQK